MNRFFITIFFVILLSFNSAFGSDNIFSKLNEEVNQQGEVDIIQDQEVEKLVMDYLEAVNKRETIPGYRVCIFRDSEPNSRADAQNIRAMFISKYGKISSYLIYDQPYWKVYIGDFRSRFEATQVMNLIKKDFKQVWIVNDQINFPALD